MPSFNSALRKFVVRSLGRFRRRPGPRIRSLIERLEPRLFLTGEVMVDDPSLDTITSDNVAYTAQDEAANLVFDPVGSNTPNIVAGYNDRAMLQSNPYGAGAHHADGWSLSTDGGATFSRPQGSAPLPDGPGSNAYGDNGNSVLARNSSNGNIFMATVSGYFPYGGNAYQPMPDIQVFESTDGGVSFAAPVNATPDFTTSDALDKPWITADNLPGGTGQKYLTFVNLNTSSDKTPGIYLTSSSDGVTWPYVNYGDSLAVASNGDVLHGPQVVLTYNSDYPQLPHIPYVIYLRESPDNNTAQIEASTSGMSRPQVLTTLNPTVDDTNSPPDMMVATGDGTPIRAEYFPSAAYDPLTNEIFVTYADRDSNTHVPHVYLLKWQPGSNVVSQPVEIPIPGDASNVGEAFNPTLTISPTGTKLFVGFYGLPNSSTDDVYVYGATATIAPNPGSSALTWDTTRQLAGPFPPSNTSDGRISSGGLGNYFYYWGDYDTASADYDNFYYTHMKTTPMTFYVNGVQTTYNQEDVYLAKIPINYGTSRPTTPQGVIFDAFAAGGPTLYWDASAYGGGQPNPEIHLQYSLAASGSSPAVQWTDVASPLSGSQGSMTLPSSINYNPSKTYYFRLRAQDQSTVASSSWSTVVTEWAHARVGLGFVGYQYQQTDYYYADEQRTQSVPLYLYDFLVKIFWLPDSGAFSGTTAYAEYSLDGGSHWLSTYMDPNKMMIHPTATMDDSGGNILIYLAQPVDPNNPPMIRFRLGQSQNGVQQFSNLTAGMAASDLANYQIPAPNITSMYYSDGSLYVTWDNGGDYPSSVDMQLWTLENTSSGSESDGPSWQEVEETYPIDGQMVYSGLDSGQTYSIRLDAAVFVQYVYSDIDNAYHPVYLNTYSGTWSIST